MTVSTQEPTEKVQATFVKVAQNFYRNDSSQTYYGLTERDGKQFRTTFAKRGFLSQANEFGVRKMPVARLQQGK